MKIFIMIIAVGLITLGLWLLVQKLNCKKQIEAVYIRSESIISRGSNIHTPVFHYELASHTYEQAAMESFSCGKKSERYAEGAVYPIYVNEKRPACFWLEKRIRPDDISLILVGIIFLFFLFL